MDQKVENERSFRMPIRAEIICSVNGDDFQGKIRDMSSTGFFMETTICPPTGSKCDIHIGLNGSHSRLIIDKLGGIIIRSDAHGVGIELDARLEWVALIPIYFQQDYEKLMG
jgi:hypothetical protein